MTPSRLKNVFLKFIKRLRWREPWPGAICQAPVAAQGSALHSRIKYKLEQALNHLLFLLRLGDRE